MKNSNNDDESKFWQVLEKNRLVDLSQFHRPGFFDEVPLYTRYADIAFLAKHSSAEASAILMRFALKFLRSVICYEEHDAPFFAAVTVSDFSEGDPIVPNLFVWSKPIRELLEKLSLEEPSTSFAKKVKRWVSQAHLPHSHAILEEKSTTSDFPRAFIAPALPPYPGFVQIYKFCRFRDTTEEQAKRPKKTKWRSIDAPWSPSQDEKN